jgi:hypothetical protein
MGEAYVRQEKSVRNGQYWPSTRHSVLRFLLRPGLVEVRRLVHFHLKPGKWEIARTVKHGERQIAEKNGHDEEMLPAAEVGAQRNSGDRNDFHSCSQLDRNPRLLCRKPYQLSHFIPQKAGFSQG